MFLTCFLVFCPLQCDMLSFCSENITVKEDSSNRAETSVITCLSSLPKLLLGYHGNWNKLVIMLSKPKIILWWWVIWPFGNLRQTLKKKRWPAALSIAHNREMGIIQLLKSQYLCFSSTIFLSYITLLAIHCSDLCFISGGRFPTCGCNVNHILRWPWFAA